MLKTFPAAAAALIWFMTPGAFASAPLESDHPGHIRMSPGVAPEHEAEVEKYLAQRKEVQAELDKGGRKKVTDPLKKKLAVIDGLLSQLGYTQDVAQPDEADREKEHLLRLEQQREAQEEEIARREAEAERRLNELTRSKQAELIQLAKQKEELESNVRKLSSHEGSEEEMLVSHDNVVSQDSGPIAVEKTSKPSVSKESVEDVLQSGRSHAEPGLLARLYNGTKCVFSSVNKSAVTRYAPGTYPQFSIDEIIERFQASWNIKEGMLVKDCQYSLPPHDYKTNVKMDGVWDLIWLGRTQNSFVTAFVTCGRLNIEITDLVKRSKVTSAIKDPIEKSHAIFKAYREELRYAKRKDDLAHYTPEYKDDKTSTPPIDFLRYLFPLTESGLTQEPFLLDIQACRSSLNSNHTHTQIVLRAIGFDPKKGHAVHFSFYGYRVPNAIAKEDISRTLNKFENCYESDWLGKN